MAGSFTVVPADRSMLELILTLSDSKLREQSLQMEKQKLSATLPLLNAQARQANAQASQAEMQTQVMPEQLSLETQRQKAQLSYMGSQKKSLDLEVEAKKWANEHLRSMQLDSAKLKAAGDKAELDLLTQKRDVLKNASPEKITDLYLMDSIIGSARAEAYNHQAENNLLRTQLSMVQEFNNTIEPLVKDMPPQDYARLMAMRQTGATPQEQIAFAGPSAAKGRLDKQVMEAGYPGVIQLENMYGDSTNGPAEWIGQSSAAYGGNATKQSILNGAKPPEVRQMKVPRPSGVKNMFGTWNPNKLATEAEAKVAGLGKEWASGKVVAGGNNAKPVSQRVTDTLAGQNQAVMDALKLQDGMRKQIENLLKQNASLAAERDAALKGHGKTEGTIILGGSLAPLESK